MAGSGKKIGDSTPRKRSGGEGATEAKGARWAAGKDPARKKGKRIEGGSREGLSRQISVELLKLRPTLKDVGAALLDRLDGELAGLAHALNGDGLPGESRVLPRLPVLSAMLADIQVLKVKPNKGRVKDLRRIEALLESLSSRMPSET